MSERDVVVEVIRLRFASRRLRRARARCGALLAAAQQLELLRDDLGRVVVDAILLVLARLQAALDVARLALRQILAGDLREAIEEHDPVPLGFFLHLTGGLDLPLARRRDRDVRDRRAARCITRLGIAPEVPDHDYLVHASHVALSCTCTRPSILLVGGRRCRVEVRTAVPRTRPGRDATNAYSWDQRAATARPCRPAPTSSAHSASCGTRSRNASRSRPTASTRRRPSRRAHHDTSAG